MAHPQFVAEGAAQTKAGRWLVNLGKSFMPSNCNMVLICGFPYKAQLCLYQDRI